MNPDGAEDASVRIFDNLKFLELFFQFIGGQPHGQPDCPQRAKVVERGAADAKSRLMIHGGSLRQRGFHGNCKKSRSRG